MRLTKEELEGIRSACVEVLPAAGWSLYLFGSRVDDSLRGGDIDLLMLTDSPESKSVVLARRTSLLVALKDRIGEQRIDLVVGDQKAVAEDPFLKQVMQTAVLLHPVHLESSTRCGTLP